MEPKTLTVFVLSTSLLGSLLQVPPSSGLILSRFLASSSSPLRPPLLLSLPYFVSPGPYPPHSRLLVFPCYPPCLHLDSRTGPLCPSPLVPPSPLSSFLRLDTNPLILVLSCLSSIMLSTLPQIMSGFSSGSRFSASRETSCFKTSSRGCLIRIRPVPTPVVRTSPHWDPHLSTRYLDT